MIVSLYHPLGKPWILIQRWMRPNCGCKWLENGALLIMCCVYVPPVHCVISSIADGCRHTRWNRKETKIGSVLAAGYLLICWIQRCLQIAQNYSDTWIEQTLFRVMMWHRDVKTRILRCRRQVTISERSILFQWVIPISSIVLRNGCKH